MIPKQGSVQPRNHSTKSRSEENPPRIIRLLNGCFRSIPLKWIFRTPSPGQRTDPMSFGETEFETTPVLLAQIRPTIKFAGKKILDIGCGVGGKSTFLALHGASEVVAIDLDSERIALAAEFAGLKKAGNIEFVQADAAFLPRSWSGRFDLVTMIDTFEHLDDPGKVLSEISLVLKDSGILIVGFPPYKSPWGAHLFDRISFPWAHLFFPEQYLVELWKLGRSGIGKGIASAEKLTEMHNATRIHEVRHLNGMTIERFWSLVADSDFRMVDCRLHSLLRIFTFLIKNFSIREYLTIRVVAVLEKAKGVSF